MPGQGLGVRGEALGWEDAVPGVWLWALQPHSANEWLGEQGPPALCPHFPRGTLGLLRGHKVFELQGGGHKLGICMTPKLGGQRRAPPRTAGDKGPL